MNDKREGPSRSVRRSCMDCRYEASERYAVQGDSGHNVFCTYGHGKRHIADSSWNTPSWCPFIDAESASLESARAGEAAALERVAELEARLLKLYDALVEIINYQPEPLEPLPDDWNANCAECALAAERHWPPSQLCDKHYRALARRRDEELARSAVQHYAMRDIARCAIESGDEPKSSICAGGDV